MCFLKNNFNWRNIQTLFLVSVISLSFSYTYFLGYSKADNKETQTIKFLGFDIKKLEGLYIVKTEVNIRAAPKTKSKKLGTLKKHERIRVLGESPGAWVAVVKKSKEIGFVYKPALLEIINGRLEKPIVGTIELPDKPTCTYKIEFEGKSPAEGQLFEMIDYGIEWSCRKEYNKGRRQNLSPNRKTKKPKKKINNSNKIKELIKFYTPMFVPESGQRTKKMSLHQITIDFVDTPFEEDGVLSTTSFYSLKNNTLEFGEVSVKGLSLKLKKTKVKANTIREVLIASVEMAYTSWHKKIWDHLFSLKKF